MFRVGYLSSLECSLALNNVVFHKLFLPSPLFLKCSDSVHFIWRGVGDWDKFCSFPFFLIPLFFSKMLMVLYKRSHLHFSHLPTHEMFWMPSVVIYKAINKIKIKKELSQMPIPHLSLSACLSHFIGIIIARLPTFP